MTAELRLPCTICGLQAESLSHECPLYLRRMPRLCHFLYERVWFCTCCCCRRAGVLEGICLCTAYCASFNAGGMPDGATWQPRSCCTGQAVESMQVGLRPAFGRHLPSRSIRCRDTHSVPLRLPAPTCQGGGAGRVSAKANCFCARSRCLVAGLCLLCSPTPRG